MFAELLASIATDPRCVVVGPVAMTLQGLLTFADELEVAPEAADVEAIRGRLISAGLVASPLDPALFVAADDPWRRVRITAPTRRPPSLVEIPAPVRVSEWIGGPAPSVSELPATQHPFELDARLRRLRGSAMNVAARIAWLDHAVTLARHHHPAGPPGEADPEPRRQVLSESEPPRLVGYWRPNEGALEQEAELPTPHERVDPAWNGLGRATLAQHLRFAPITVGMMGFSRCRLCGMVNGTREQTDGTFVWPEGLAHYVEDHAVRLPTELEAHALAVADEREADPAVRVRSKAWWLARTR